MAEDSSKSALGLISESRYSDRVGKAAHSGGSSQTLGPLPTASTRTTTIKSKPSSSFNRGEAYKTMRIADYYANQTSSVSTIRSMKSLQENLSLAPYAAPQASSL